MKMVEKKEKSNSQTLWQYESYKQFITGHEINVKSHSTVELIQIKVVSLINEVCT